MLAPLSFGEVQEERARQTLGARHNATRVGGNIHTCNGLVMALQLFLELEGIADLAIQLNIVVACDGQGLVVRGEGVVRNGVVEEMMNLWSGHNYGI